MRGHHSVCFLLSVLAWLSLLDYPVKGATGTVPPLVNLKTGTDLRIQQNVDVNVVLVGFGGLVDLVRCAVHISSADGRAATAISIFQGLPPMPITPCPRG